MTYVSSPELLQRLREGNAWALGRLISRAEAGVVEVQPTLAEVYRAAGAAHLIGLTGVPGSGKSTLVGKLAVALRKRGEKVGIVAIDPSSPYSGGAILGDRIRMSEVGNDIGVYIRSMATRGATGGMARAALDAADLMDVAGYHTIILETVGVGQDEVEIAHASDTTVVVSAPGLGDEIQAIKAGVLEIADIHVVSKCDRDDANRTLTDLKRMLALEATLGRKREWTVPVVGVSSYAEQGIDELLDYIAAHRAAMGASKLGVERRRQVAEFRLRKTAETILLERFGTSAIEFSRGLADRLTDRLSDPYAAARELIVKTIRKEYSNDLA